MPCAYYNEFDPFAAQWLRNLIAAGHIAPGEVDERSITEVQPDDLRGFTQCHFFAGIGGWSYALRLAGWADDRPVWTGSCPCQPFSAAGKQRGSNDERHLWPAFFDLIRECGPRAVFGEQVAGAAGYAWWDHVAADLEGEGYAAAAADIGAHSVGAPHLRQRLYWVAHAGGGRREQHRLSLASAPRGSEGQGDQRQRVWPDAGHGSFAGRVVDADPCAAGQRRDAGGAQGSRLQSGADVDGCSLHGSLGHTAVPGPQGREQPGQRADAQHEAAERAGEAGSLGDAPVRGCAGIGWSGQAGVAESSPWRDLEWIACSDGKARPTEPGLFPLVDGVRDGRLAVGSALGQSAASLSEAQAQHRFNRVGVLRGAGNAIVPQVAAAFVRAAA